MTFEQFLETRRYDPIYDYDGAFEPCPHYVYGSDMVISCPWIGEYQLEWLGTLYEGPLEELERKLYHLYISEN